MSDSTEPVNDGFNTVSREEDPEFIPYDVLYKIPEGIVTKKIKQEFGDYYYSVRVKYGVDDNVYPHELYYNGLKIGILEKVDRGLHSPLIYWRVVGFMSPKGRVNEYDTKAETINRYLAHIKRNPLPVEPKIISCRKEKDPYSTGGYKAFKGLGGGASYSYLVVFEDGREYRVKIDDKEAAKTEALRLHKIKLDEINSLRHESNLVTKNSLESFNEFGNIKKITKFEIEKFIKGLEISEKNAKDIEEKHKISKMIKALEISLRHTV